MSPLAERAAATVPHVRVDADGIAWIDDTNVKVVEVVLDKLAHGWSPEEIHFQHRDLSLAQIYGALSWYYDHQVELDREIERQLQDIDAEAPAGGDSSLRARLRRLGHLP